MNKFLFKIILMMLFILLSFMIFENKIYAVDSVIKGADNFIASGENQTSPINNTDIKNTSDTIYNILLAGGVGVAVCVSAVLGIQFMIGSMETQAKVKESLIPFIVGCVIIFGAFGIWKIAAIFANNIGG